MRIPRKRRDATYFAFLHACLEKMAEVRAVETNPLLGSVLLVTSLCAEDIFAYAKRHQLFEKLEEKIAQDPITGNILSRVARGVKKADNRLKESTNGMIDMKTLAFGAFAGLGIYQITRGQVLASASALMMSAFTFFPFDSDP